MKILDFATSRKDLAHLSSVSQTISNAATFPASNPLADSTRFSLSTKGVIVDSATGLQWLVGPNGVVLKHLRFEEAEAWAKNCNVRGSGWRLPSIEEMQNLHPPTTDKVWGLGFFIDPIFQRRFHWGANVFWGTRNAHPSQWTYNFAKGMVTSCQVEKAGVLVVRKNT